MYNNLIFIEDGYAEIVVCEDGWIDANLETHKLREGQYVFIRDASGPKQIAKGFDRTGKTIIYYSNKQFARDCKARLFKTRARFEMAKAKLDTMLDA